MAADQTAKLRHLAAIILAELAIERATKKAFKAWLPKVKTAILYGKAPTVADQDPQAPLLAAADGNNDGDDNGTIYVINPDAGELTRKLWEALAAVVLLEIGKVFTAQYVGAGATSRDVIVAREAYLASVRSRLYALPDEVFVRVQQIVSQGIREGISKDELAKRVRRELNPQLEIYLDRARKVGRTEAISGYNAGRHQAYLELARVTGQSWTKRWLSVRDFKVRHTHSQADGQQVALAAKFNVGGFTADYPGDPRLPAQEAVNCRCVAIYAGTRGNGDAMTTPIVANAYLWGGGSFDPADPNGRAAIVASIDEAFAADGRLPNGWRGPMAPLGRPTGDGRQLNVPEGGVRSRDLPITFDWAPSREGGHDGAVMAGRIDRVWVEGDMLWGEGALDLGGQAGYEYARQLADGFAMFVSVDPDEITFEQWFLNAEGEQVPFNEAVMVGDGEQTLKEGYVVLDVMTDWRLAGVTAVTIPAFQEARIEPVYDYAPKTEVAAALDAGLPPQDELLDLFDTLDMEDEAGLLDLARAMKNRRAYDALTDYYDEDGIVATVVGSFSFPVDGDRKRKWDGHAARQNVAKWASSDGSGDLDKINWGKFSRCFLYRGAPDSGNALLADAPKGKSTKYKVEDFKLGFVDIIDGKPTIVANAAIGIAGGHGVTATRGIPAGEVTAIKAKLCALYSKIRKVHSDFPDCPFGGGKGGQSALIAAAGQVFALDAFENPKLDGPTPLTVKDGRVYGHVALFDSCYMAQGGASRCVKPPRNGDYSRFLSHGARLANGEVLPVGVITFGEGHFAGGSLKASMANYANMATAAAKVNVGEDEFGVWVAGEVLDQFADRADDLLLSPLSGHWEPDLDRGGELTLIASHVVVTPGFHVPRLVASFGEDGEVTAMILPAPFTFLDKSAELFDAAVESGEIEAVGEREDGVVLYAEPDLETVLLAEAVVSAVRADRQAQRALKELGLDADSRAAMALARLGVKS